MKRTLVSLRRALVGRRSRETFIIRRPSPEVPVPGIKGILGYDDAVALYHVFNREGLGGSDPLIDTR